MYKDDIELKTIVIRTDQFLCQNADQTENTENTEIQKNKFSETISR